jgi:hypothetical protein
VEAENKRKEKDVEIFFIQVLLNSDVLRHKLKWRKIIAVFWCVEGGRGGGGGGGGGGGEEEEEELRYRAK